MSEDGRRHVAGAAPIRKSFCKLYDLNAKSVKLKKRILRYFIFHAFCETMRTHYDILKEASLEAVEKALPVRIPLNTVRSWRQRSSIPTEFWAPIVAAGYATLEELSHSAPARRRSA